MSSSSLITLRIQKIIRETGDTRSFILESPDGSPVSYLPGQFLTFVFSKTNGEEERRSYSISSACNEPLQVTVKRIPNGHYSRWFSDQAKEGDLLYTTGASGFFILPEMLETYTQLVFFAAGSGITPVYSLIKTLLQQYPLIKLALIYSSVSAEQTIFYAALRQLQADHADRLRIDFLFSRTIPRKRLNVHMIAEAAHRYGNDALFYLCGPIEYMRSISIVLRTEGIPVQSIRKEIFHIEKTVMKERPPDTFPHQVTARIDGKEYAFSTQYPVTILQAAKALKIPVPYSCEAGQCGTCSATCVSGKVWMGRNEVLLEEETAKARVLTCTGYPVGGDVVLQF